MSRPFDGAADYAALIEFASDETRARLPDKSDWHPGDIVWQLAGSDPTRPNEALQLWYEAHVLRGVVWHAEGLFRIVARASEDESIVTAMFDWCEGATGVGAVAATIAFDDDARRLALLERRGYRRFERGSVHLRRDLRTAAPPPELPPALRFRDARTFDVNERVALHVDAWSHLEHLGMPDAASSFSPERHRRLVASPVYQPELDLVVEAEDGTYVTGALCWADTKSGVGLTEPVGTRFAWRGKGLSRAVNLEGVRRMRALGLHTAEIQTADFNHAAQATYRSCGYAVLKHDHWWAKRLD